MAQYQKISILLLRLGIGWMFFYAGITKILNPAWTSAGYLKSAKTFTFFYQTLLSPSILPIVDFINEWGLLLLGISLIFGIFVRLSSIFGAVLMLLYYFPILDFPYPNPYSFIIDEHIIYALILILFAALRVGRIYGFEEKCANLPICSKFPRLRKWLG